jgi:hypothetical protein
VQLSTALPNILAISLLLLDTLELITELGTKIIRELSGSQEKRTKNKTDLREFCHFLRGGFLFCWGEKMIYEWRLRKKN